MDPWCRGVCGQSREFHAGKSRSDKAGCKINFADGLTGLHFDCLRRVFHSAVVVEFRGEIRGELAEYSTKVICVY